MILLPNGTLEPRVGTKGEQNGGCPGHSMYCRDWVAASSFYYKADRGSDSGITTSVSPALEEASRRGGESRVEVQAFISLPLLLISSHIINWGGGDAVWHLFPGH